MRNKVYYGEYTLQHWVNLMLGRNIILPEYQRTFVWDKAKVQGFFNSIRRDYYVPPVTIGFLKRNNESSNIIIDGQQRLTSLILGCLEIYPSPNFWNNSINIGFADDNDDDLDDNSSVLGWTYEELLKSSQYLSLEELKKTYNWREDSDDRPKYEKLNLDVSIDNDFLNKHYLGFSYLVPYEGDAQKYYSYTFKNINTTGVSLLPLESRKSMYFLGDNLDEFFDPSFLKSILVENGKKMERVDFVRYLSLAFQYEKIKNSGGLAKNYGRRMEDYYSEFINAAVNEEETDLFSKCDIENRSQVENLKNTLDKFGLSTHRFRSIIDVDIYMFGMVYYVIVAKRKIKTDKTKDICYKLDREINGFKEDEKHKKSPAALKYLRRRLDRSVEIYKEYL